MLSAKPLIVLFVSLLLTGCGFQLRGTDIGALDAISLSGSVPAETRRVLRRSLEDYGVETVAAAPGIVNVQLLDERSSRRPVATSARIDAAQYELRLELDINLVLNGKSLGQPASLSAERIYSVDSLNLSGSYEEQQILLAEIRSELAGMIIRRVEAVAQSER